MEDLIKGMRFKNKALRICYLLLGRFDKSFNNNKK